MNKILSKDEINLFKEQGAVFLKNKFDISWINKLKKGIERDIRTQVLDLNHTLFKKMSQPI